MDKRIDHLVSTNEHFKIEMISDKKIMFIGNKGTRFTSGPVTGDITQDKMEGITYGCKGY